VTDGTTQSATEPPVRRLGMRTTLTYAVGSVAYGVKDNGFQAFLLIFYNQVMGLSAVAVGATIMAALILDAFADPLIGVASDRTRSRWGRRHPWMYASALPIAVGWLLLWNPPAMSDAALLGWVFASAVVVRTAVSSYEVPSSALTPELSADYDERTRIIAYRHLFGWIGGLSMLVAAYTLFLVPTPGEPNGLLNREGYRLYAITGAIVMFVAIMASAVGTHREIGRLPQVTNDPVPLRQVFGELLETIRNRPFAILMAAGLCCYTAQGLAFALSNYLYTFVWRFPASAFLMIGGVLLAGVVVAFVIAPRLAHRFGKRRAASALMIASPILLTGPYLLRLLSLFPEPGNAAMLPVLFATMVANVTCAVSAAIIATSMMADVVEHSEATTGRRSEGVFAAGNFFVQKTTGGIGIFLAGVVLSLAGFPEGAIPGAVPEATLDRLTIVFSVSVVAVAWAAALLFFRFPFDREEHETRISGRAVPQ
jgi:glycoside/pentoside/hexuronide:cation symporter, GPH family